MTLSTLNYILIYFELHFYSCLGNACFTLFSHVVRGLYLAPFPAKFGTFHHFPLQTVTIDFFIIWPKKPDFLLLPNPGDLFGFPFIHHFVRSLVFNYRLSRQRRRRQCESGNRSKLVNHWIRRNNRMSVWKTITEVDVHWSASDLLQLLDRRVHDLSSPHQ